MIDTEPTNDPKSRSIDEDTDPLDDLMTEIVDLWKDSVWRQRKITTFDYASEIGERAVRSTFDVDLEQVQIITQRPSWNGQPFAIPLEWCPKARVYSLDVKGLGCTPVHITRRSFNEKVAWEFIRDEITRIELAYRREKITSVDGGRASDWSEEKQKDDQILLADCIYTRLKKLIHSDGPFVVRVRSSDAPYLKIDDLDRISQAIADWPDHSCEDRSSCGEQWQRFRNDNTFIRALTHFHAGYVRCVVITPGSYPTFAVLKTIETTVDQTLSQRPRLMKSLVSWINPVDWTIRRGVTSFYSSDTGTVKVIPPAGARLDLPIHYKSVDSSEVISEGGAWAYYANRGEAGPAEFSHDLVNLDMVAQRDGFLMHGVFIIGLVLATILPFTLASPVATPSSWAVAIMASVPGLSLAYLMRRTRRTILSTMLNRYRWLLASAMSVQLVLFAFWTTMQDSAVFEVLGISIKPQNVSAIVLSITLLLFLDAVLQSRRKWARIRNRFFGHPELSVVLSLAISCTLGISSQVLFALAMPGSNLLPMLFGEFLGPLVALGAVHMFCVHLYALVRRLRG